MNRYAQIGEESVMQQSHWLQNRGTSIRLHKRQSYAVDQFVLDLLITANSCTLEEIAGILTEPMLLVWKNMT